MAHLDLQEQEQVEQIKHFWSDWGKYLILLLILIGFGYGVSTFYTWQKTSQSQKAVSIYQNVVTAINANNSTTVFSDTDKLIADYPGTEYAPMAAMSAAKIAFDTKDYTKAEKYLVWSKDNSVDNSLKSVAVLRLASVYVDENNFDKAREVLKTKHDIAFDGLFYEAKGDVYVAMGDLDKARDSYKEGLQKAANDPSTQQAIQMKMQLIGS